MHSQHTQVNGVCLVVKRLALNSYSNLRVNVTNPDIIQREPSPPL
jgi:hypothetical protein